MGRTEADWDKAGRKQKQKASSPDSHYPEDLQRGAVLQNTPGKDHSGALFLNYH